MSPRIGRSQALAPQVLYSGVVSADMLGAMPMEVEVGSAELAPGLNAEPETAWFADGGRLARKVPGKGTLVVAALGPRVDARPLSATDRRVVSSRAYELRRGGNRYLGSVVEVGGKTICSSVLPAGAVPSGPYAWVLRCPVPGGTTGLLHVVGTPRTETVAVQLAPTPAPAGQRAFKGTVTRPAGSYDRVGFAVLETVASGFPCGAGTVQAAGGGTEAAPSVLPLYKP